MSTPTIPWSVVHNKFVADASATLEEATKTEIKRLKDQSKGAMSHTAYIEKTHALDPELGQKVLDGYVTRFSQVGDKPIGKQMRSLRDAAGVISIKVPTHALLFQKDGTVEPVPAAARRLHDGLLTLPPGPPHIPELREKLRAVVDEEMMASEAWPTLVRIGMIVGEHVEAKVVDDKLEELEDIAFRLAEVAQKKGLGRQEEIASLLKQLDSFGLVEYVPFAEEPVDTALKA